LDDQKRDVSRSNIYIGDMDRILTNQLHIDENEIIGFGVERMHLFDRKTQKFTARCYDFAFDYDQAQGLPSFQGPITDFFEVEDVEQEVEAIEDPDCSMVRRRRKTPAPHQAVRESSTSALSEGAEDEEMSHQSALEDEDGSDRE
jgi:hypothetical protein